MAATCKNPDCSDRSWWGGWCRLCWQVTGIGDQVSADRREQEVLAAAAKVDAERERASDKLRELGSAGLLPWWEVSEQLNAAGFRLDGRPYTPATARGAYLVMTAGDWE